LLLKSETVKTLTTFV